VAKSLKEALLEQMAALQERGLAPGEIPVEQEEEPSYYANFDDEAERRLAAYEREREPRRRGAGGPGGLNGGRPQRIRSRPAAQPRREGRDAREARAGRERREGRDGREGLVEMAPAAPPRTFPAPRPAGGPGGPRPMMTGPRPMGGMQGGPRPMAGGPRPAPRADMLRRNAERMQREQAERVEIQQLLTSYNGAEADEAALESFFSQLAVETGALPPFNVVLSAMQSAGSASPAEVGNQVRLYYRRARARAAQPAGVSS
jgi:hypothetical protein